jgi:argininosuccinate synthase
MLTSSQRRVSGETRVRLAPGRFQVVGARSPHTLFDGELAVYGEENHLWSGEESRAFARIAAIPSMLATRGGAA